MLPESGTLMTLPKRNWMDMTWQDVAGAGADAARWIAVLPLAAVEQHGPHLPLGVDTYIAEAYLARVKKSSPQTCRCRSCRCSGSASPPSICPIRAR